ncbi:hypothetical protein A7R75_29870 [Mycolicibacterium llatzerense]|nr:hypothetical protein [Mycolicibacterium llatzerense]
MVSDIVFMDTETLGVHIDAPIWELAAIRRRADGTETELHMFIQHHPNPWVDDPKFPDSFKDDYRARYDERSSWSDDDAAWRLMEFMAGRPHVVGAVPNFDTERIAHQLLRPNGFAEPWHHHLIDVENLAVGFIAGRAMMGDLDSGLAMPDLPWNSNDLSRAIGVDPDEFDRHTALGDVRWVKAQFDAIMGGAL